MATTAHRPRLSRDFMHENQKRRILDALAACVVDRGYRATHVAEIVREGHVARNTFYDNYGAKEAGAEALGADFTGHPDDIHHLAFGLAVDLAAAFRGEDKNYGALSARGTGPFVDPTIPAGRRGLAGRIAARDSGSPKTFNALARIQAVDEASAWGQLDRVEDLAREAGIEFRVYAKGAASTSEPTTTDPKGGRS